MTHLLDTHAWIQRSLAKRMPPLVEEVMGRHAETLASRSFAASRDEQL